MRVLHIINDLRPAGAEMLVRQIAPRLRDLGCDVQVALLADTPSFVKDELAQTGIPIHVPPAPMGFYAAPKQVPYLARVLREVRPDIAHVHLFPAQLWAVSAWQRLLKPERPLLVTTEHNTHNRRRESWWGRPLDTWMYGQYAHLIAITEATKTSLCDWVPPVCAKTMVVQNGVDLARMETAAPIDKSVLLNLPADEAAQISLLTCVGRLEEQKDQATLMRALPFLPPTVHVALVGVGEKESELRALAENLTLTRRIHFLGRRAEVPQIVRASDVYVQPSAWEGFGIAAVEALAAGVPVIVSDVPGLADVVGDAARKFPPGDTSALAWRIQAVLAQSLIERAETVARGRERARQFSIEACASAHLRLYEELASPLP